MKDKALRLADLIDSDFDPDWMAEEGFDQIAAELRRLHEVNAELLKALEALVTADELHDELWDQVHAAIANATGGVA